MKRQTAVQYRYFDVYKLFKEYFVVQPNNSVRWKYTIPIDVFCDRINYKGSRTIGGSADNVVNTYTLGMYIYYKFGRDILVNTQSGPFLFTTSSLSSATTSAYTRILNVPSCITLPSGYDSNLPEEMKCHNSLTIEVSGTNVLIYGG